jgi:hypothetical protein
MPPQHMENFGTSLDMTQCQEQNPFAGIKCFLKLAEDKQYGRLPSTTWTDDNNAWVKEPVQSN